MFEKNKIRISELETRIAALGNSIKENDSMGKALLAQGERSAGKLKDYFAGVLNSSSAGFAELLADRPLPSVAGWGEPRWQSWDVRNSRDESFIRAGELVEQRSNGAFRIPGYIPFIGLNKTIIISGRKVEEAAALMQSLIVRTALMLPHQARYTLLDPAGNGIAFPMRRFLPHVQENTGDVRRDLDQVIVQIQRVIETYLDATTTSFETVPHEIRINERFQFVFAADFPDRYDRRAIEALQSIANTGPVAGTYVFIHHNPNHALPRDMGMAGFKNAFTIDLDGSNTVTQLQLTLATDGSPAPDLQTLVFKLLGEAKPPERIIEWEKVAGLPEEQWWTENSTRIIEAPIGARGGGDRLRLWFGVNHDNQPCAHGMLGAMTGAGKSNLYHSFISGLTVRYGPDELRLYLIDGKDGVEFQPYRVLPHAEVVSLRSSPELSRSVLAELIAEKERRNAIFVRAGVNDLTTYRAKGELEGRLPRILLLVDEYQELFEGDKDGVASNFLLQLSQQGRSAGIHMLLGSQRFGAAGMLNQTGIFGNIHLLLAMKMKVADTQALSEFGRRGKALIATCDLPGKIVVNDQGGDDGANITGKVAYLPLAQLDQLLQSLTEKAKSLPDESLPRRVVFNGKAQPSLIDNPYVSRLLRHSDWMSSLKLAEFAGQSVESGGLGIVDWFPEENPRAVWLGQQFNVRGQALVVFRRRVSENALIIGGANAARYGMLAATLMSLALNLDPTKTRFAIFDRSISGSRWHGVLQTVAESFTSSGFSVSFAKEAAKAESFVNELIAELDRRKAIPEDMAVEEPSFFAVMTELDGVESLRRKPDAYGGLGSSTAGENLRRLYVEGPPLGIHLILSFSGVRPMINVIDERRGLVNFRHRVALQMSEDDSHTLTRGRKASQLQIEGPTPICALYLDVENDTSVRFKPYSSDPAVVAQNEELIDQVRMIGETLAERRK
ncbi:MAG TPA: FtsK/SpoIIIE domain-containing protein [Pyrinomonadaceae bacterium]|nr:FtsK/SpoIIIE domain-containing protein [Pyrinomonadaceae bacterium]